jgi:hypothetical protein
VKSILLILVISKLSLSCDYSDDDLDIWISAVSAGEYVDLYADPAESVGWGYISFQAEPSHVNTDYRCDWQLQCSDGYSRNLDTPACRAVYTVSALDAGQSCTIKLEVEGLWSDDYGRSEGHFTVE